LAAAVGASLVLLIGMLVLGTQFAHWPEWEGRIVGGVGTSAGIIGAIVGLIDGSKYKAALASVTTGTITVDVVSAVKSTTPSHKCLLRTLE